MPLTAAQVRSWIAQGPQFSSFVLPGIARPGAAPTFVGRLVAPPAGAVVTGISFAIGVTPILTDPARGWRAVVQVQTGPNIVRVAQLGSEAGVWLPDVPLSLTLPTGGIALGPADCLVLGVENFPMPLAGGAAPPAPLEQPSFLVQWSAQG